MFRYRCIDGDFGGDRETQCIGNPARDGCAPLAIGRRGRQVFGRTQCDAGGDLIQADADAAEHAPGGSARVKKSHMEARGRANRDFAQRPVAMKFRGHGSGVEVGAHGRGVAGAKKVRLAMLVDSGRTCRPAVARLLGQDRVRKLKLHRRFPYACAVYVAPSNASTAAVGVAQSVGACGVSGVALATISRW